MPSRTRRRRATGRRLEFSGVRASRGRDACALSRSGRRGPARELGDQLQIARALSATGEDARIQGDHARARELSEEALGLFRARGAKEATAITLHKLGHIARRLDDLRATCARFTESMVMSREIAMPVTVVNCLDRLAGVEVAAGRPARAARFFGAAAAERERIGASIYPGDRADIDESTAAARAALGELAFRRAVDEGRATPIGQAVDEALAE